jgi:predicted lipoprotein with Yx(FWY)xxD motif
MNARGTRKFSSTAGLGVAAVALAAFAAACGSSGSGSDASASSGPSASASVGSAPSTGSPAPAKAASVEVKTMSGDLGSFLTDGSGKTLYLFTADTSGSGKSTCNGACATAWPPLTSTDMPKADSGVTANKLATIKRDDGTTQVTYNGHPLYYYSGDAKAGDTKGQGFGAKWYVLSPAGDGIMKTAAAPSSGSSTGTGSGSDAGGGWS